MRPLSKSVHAALPAARRDASRGFGKLPSSCAKPVRASMPRSPAFGNDLLAICHGNPHAQTKNLHRSSTAKTGNPAYLQPQTLIHQPKWVKARMFYGLWSISTATSTSAVHGAIERVFKSVVFILGRRCSQRKASVSLVADAAA